MYTFFVVLLVLDAVVLIAVVLLQSGKGGGLAANFGGASSSTDAFVGTRQAANLLTKMSWGAGGFLLFLALMLQIASNRARVPSSVLDRPFSQQPSAPSPTAGATAVPLQPAPEPAPTAAPTPPAGKAPGKTPSP